jgi:hypothetical protein
MGKKWHTTGKRAIYMYVYQYFQGPVGPPSTSHANAPPSNEKKEKEKTTQAVKGTPHIN